MTLPVLWYFADPMCSWCWGFSPIISKLKNNLDGKVNVALTLGGLRPDETRPITNSSREDILHHWHEVEAMTGQVFNYDNALPEDFIYNTEPACRAVITMATLRSELTMLFFSRIQSAFYTRNMDVTQLDTLLELARNIGIDKIEEFTQLFNSDELRQKTVLHFQRTREYGVTGFPTLILQKNDNNTVLTRGYKPLAEIEAQLNTLL